MSQQNIHPTIESVVGCLGLTRRQAEIVCCIAMGLGVPELSQALSISPATVRTHLRDIFRSLNVRSRTELVSTVLSNVLSLVDSPAADYGDSSPSDCEPFRPDSASLMTANPRVARTAHPGKVSRACEYSNPITAASAVVTVVPKQA